MDKKTNENNVDSSDPSSSIPVKTLSDGSYSILSGTSNGKYLKSTFTKDNEFHRGCAGKAACAGSAGGEEGRDHSHAGLADRGPANPRDTAQLPCKHMNLARALRISQDGGQEGWHLAKKKVQQSAEKG